MVRDGGELHRWLHSLGLSSYMLCRMVCREPMIDGPVVLGSKTVRALGSGFWFGQQTGLEGPWVRPCYLDDLIIFYLGVLHKLKLPELARVPGVAASDIHLELLGMLTA